MEITAQMVKELREATGVGMMDCKKALAETNGDMEAAIDWLRTRGLAKAAKKAGRVAAEGLVGVSIEGTKGAIVEVNSESDFVGRNEQFQSIVGNIAKLAIEANGDVHVLSEMPYPGSGRSVSGRRCDRQDRREHEPAPRRGARGQERRRRQLRPQHEKPGLGKLGVIVALRSAATRRSSPRSASSSPCTSPTPSRSRCRPTTSTRRWWPASAPSSPSRRDPASRPDHRRWSRAACASSTRR